MLEIRGLQAGYGETQILRGIDLTVPEGALVAVLGANGAGKTTLNMTISGVVRPRGGEIRFAGQSLAALSPPEIVSLGLIHVPEGRKIFPNLNVREVLELGSYRRARANRARNLERVFGIFPRLAERTRQAAGTLSGGEQQMLAIGRGLMAEPRLLILDEATSALDARTERQVCLNLLEAFRGRTVFFITHRLTTVQPADLIVLMDRGAVMEAGTHQELMARRGWYFALYQSQQQEQGI